MPKWRLKSLLYRLIDSSSSQLHLHRCFGIQKHGTRWLQRFSLLEIGILSGWLQSNKEKKETLLIHPVENSNIHSLA